MKDLLRDIRYSIRGLRRSPGFTIVAVLTLALGIGGTAAMFSVVEAVVLRPLPFPEPDRLVRLQVGVPFTARQIDGITERVTSYEALAGAARTRFTLTGGAIPEELEGAVVGHDHAAVFGVQPMLGRAFDEADAVPGATPVAVLSHGLWQRRFGGEASILGRTIPLGGEEQTSHTIVGVWPAGYAPLAWDAQVYVPAVLDPGSHAYADMARFQLAARLTPDATYQNGFGELRRVAARMATGEEGAYFPDNVVSRAVLVSYKAAQTEGTSGVLWLLLGAVGLVLLIACANVANLLLARSTGRAHEFAVRTALGAGRDRLVRQLVTESATLALFGGAVGILAAALGLPALVRMLPSAIPRTSEVSLDGSVLLFTAGVSLLAAIAFGLAPALKSSRSIEPALRAGGRSIGGGRERLRVQRVLIAVQMGLCVVLVATSGLLLKSLWQVSRVDPGFNPDDLYTMRIRPAPASFPDAEDRQRFFSEAMQRINAVPGVQAAGAIQVLPMSADNMGVGISPNDAPVPAGERATFVGYRLVTPGYRVATEIPLLEGRWIEDADLTDDVARGVVNQRMADGLFPNRSAVGATVHWNTGDPWFQVVGVVGNVHQNRLDEAPRMEAYVPITQDGEVDGIHVLARSAIGMSVLPAIRQAVWSVDPNVPISGDAEMVDVVAESMADRRFQAGLFGLFAALALALGAIGVYGVTSYTAGQRQHEVGVRLALGAGRIAVIRSILRSALAPVGVGLATGLGVALVAGHLLRSGLYAVGAADPTVFVGVPVFLTAVAGLAALVPATRAAFADPRDILGRD